MLKNPGFLRTKFGAATRAVAVAALVLCSAAVTARGQLPVLPEPGFQVIYDLTAPLEGGFRDGTPVPYTTDNSATIPSFDRVAYYYELTDTLGVKQYVYVSADPFTKSARELGLPHNRDNPVLFAQLLRAANVFSNAAGIATGTNLATARVEMWPSNYVANNFSGVPGGNDTIFDFADGGGNLAAGYGSFQIHNIAATASATGGQTLFAYNRWGVADATNDDVGIGNNPLLVGPGGNSAGLDYTFSANPTMNRLRLLILARPVPAKVVLTSWPQHQQLFPRELSGPNFNKAVVHVAGTETLGGASAVKVKLLRDGVPVAPEFSAPLTYDPITGSAPFDLPVLLPAERANYDLLLYVTKNGTDYLVNRVQDIVAGDVFIIQGQSNADAAMYSGSANAYRDPFVRTFGYTSEGFDIPIYREWHIAQGDGNRGVSHGIGQWGLVMGNQLSNANNVPVAILNGAFGGQPIGFFQRDNANPLNLNTNYGQLLFRMRAAGLDERVRAIMFYQGESENDNGLVHDVGYRALVQSWELDYPGVEHYYVCQIHPGCGTTQGNVDLRDRQRRFADTIPRHSVMSLNGIPGHNSCHWNFEDGYKLHGFHMTGLLNRDLYQPTASANVEAPNPKKIVWANEAKTAITIFLRNATDPLTVDPNMAAVIASNFTLTGSGALVTGISVQPGVITLTLSGSGDGATAVNYLGSAAGQGTGAGPGAGGGPSVLNGAGVGLLTFREAFYVPRVVRITNPAITGEIDPGTSVNVAATASVFDDGVSLQKLDLTVQGQPLGATIGGPGLTGLNASGAWTPSQPGVYTLTARAVDSVGNVFTDSRQMVVETNAAPGGVPGLVIWLKSTRGLTTQDGLVTGWADQSGQSNHASQGNFTRSPALAADQFGFLPGLRFNNNSFLSSPTGMPTGSYTKIVRHKLFDVSSSNNLISGTQNVPGVHAVFYSQSANARLFHNGEFASSSVAATPNTNIYLGATYSQPTKTGTLFLDNSPVGSGTATGDNTDVTYQVGAFQNGNFLNGALQEVMVFNRVLTANEMTQVKASRARAELTPYQRWVQDHFNGQDSSPGGDPDGDGLSNLLEYSLGTDPLVADRSQAPHVERLQDGSVVFVFDRPAGYQHLAYIVEVNTDLSLPNNWQSGDTVTLPPSMGPSPLGSGYERMTVRAKSPFAEQPHLFYRLRIGNAGN